MSISRWLRALINNESTILPCFTVYLTPEIRWPTKTVRGWNWTAGGCRSVSRAFGTWNTENFALNYDYLCFNHILIESFASGQLPITTSCLIHCRGELSLSNTSSRTAVSILSMRPTVKEQED
ncbi:hypothetical protein K435DRAFT_855362 [Dendrothele bispora CBS 962.96]|uniref:Uncharacterized protein n=1 Tax=Dendrothele bispora (strain CBS 962.96) TaxID=1314807 RepID=A0A4S8MBA3_DENBC|nr:hypothetical protein K435DRAFT_855362 [Dendrothele bispora CBS 962.96]